MTRLDDAALLQRLVAFDTVSHRSNLPLLDYLADYVDRAGVRVARLAAPDGAKANLLVELGPEPDGTRGGLLLSGHTDVVPADEADWVSDPFQLTERDGKLFGRGAADMKGFLAVAANVAAAVPLAELRQPLVLLLTYDEEVGTLGARHFADSWTRRERLPRAVLIGEPTRLRVVAAHKGFVHVRVDLSGVSAHSGYPHLGRSAIEPAAEVVRALAAVRRQFETERVPSSAWFPDVPYVPLNVGIIRGGAAPNVIPDRCTLEITLRPLPGMDPGPLLDRVQEAVRASAGAAPWTCTVVSESPPMLTSPETPILRALAEVTDQGTPETVSYATDAGWLQTLDCDCAVCGPGDIATAHKPNEYMPIADLRGARDIVERLVTRLCREAA